MQLSKDISTDDCSQGLCQSDGTNCHLFCDMRDSLQQTLNPPSDQIDHANQAGWNAFVLVHLFWQFTTENGKLVAISQPNTFILGMQNDFIAQLNIRWSGQKWDVKAVPHLQYAGTDAPSCEAAERDVYDLLFPVNHIVPQLHFIPGPTPAAGCLIKVDSLSLSTPTPASVPPGPVYILQRFGVLEAVDASAHQQWPFLPASRVSISQLMRQWYLTNTHPYRF